MKYASNWLVVLLVIVGTLVGAMSLYTASLTGVMNKMGLVGDFHQAVNQNELARQLRGQDGDIDCALWQVSKQVPYYFLSSGANHIRLGFSLGQERVICGVRHVQNGNVERGVYTIIKGLYYLKGAYNEMRGLVQQDRASCDLLSPTTYESWVQAYLRSTDGRIYQVVLTVYKQVEAERAGVEELCLD